MSESVTRRFRPTRGSGVVAVFALSCGVILLYRLSMLPPPEALLGFVVLVFCCVISCRSPFLRQSAIVVLALCTGLCMASWSARDRLSERLPADLEGKTLSVSGYLCDVPSEGSFGSLRFSLCVTHWPGISETADTSISLPEKLRLSWYRPDEAGLPGHRLRLDVVLKRPYGALNPAGFRFEDWLFRKGFRATGTVRSATADAEVPCALRCHYHRLHGDLIDWVRERFREARQFPLISSLLVGYRGYLSDSDWQVLRATGTVHLVAISGLHLGLVAVISGYLFRSLLLLFPAGYLSEAAVRRLVFALVVAVCSGYALAAGFTVPTRRALIMVAVAGWTLLCARQTPPWRALVFALAGVLLLDPYAPLDSGFWLSFAAVSVLICVFAGYTGRVGWVRGLVLAQCAVFAGLWPVLVTLEQSQPLAGAMANLVAIPWVSAVVMPVLVAGGVLVAVMPDSASFVVPLFDGVLELLWGFLGWLSRLPVPELRAQLVEVCVLAPLVLTLIFVPWLLFRVAGGGVLVLWGLVTLLQPDADNAYVAVPEVRVLDVGQGLSVLVRHGRRVLLYDTGPEVPGVYSAVESSIVPSLRALGVRRIDTLVVSHSDQDHSGGLPYLIRVMSPGRVVSGEPDRIQIRLGPDSGLRTESCTGTGEPIGDLQIDYWQWSGASNDNDASCVLRVWHPASSSEWIIPGDIGIEAESAFLDTLSGLPAPATRVLVAPHHGSKTSSSERWARSLAADLVIYSAGYRHRFGHPHPDVTARYRQAGSAALNTACSGMISMFPEARGLAIREMRHLAPFWISARGLMRDQCRIP